MSISTLAVVLSVFYHSSSTLNLSDIKNPSISTVSFLYLRIYGARRARRGALVLGLTNIEHAQIIDRA